MTQSATADAPVLDVEPGVDADAVLERLQAVLRDLGRAPADRDPALWAAHEFTRCAQMLLGTRAGRVRGADGAADLQLVLDHARSAMVSLTMARRASGHGDTIDTSGRSAHGAGSLP